MNETQIAQLEARLRAGASAFVYPPTPDLAEKVLRAGNQPLPQARRMAWALAAVAVALASLLAVPEVRARIAEFLQIGAVRILEDQPTAMATVGDEGVVPLRPTDEIQVISVLDLPAETSLEAARDAVDFPIALPSAPGFADKPDKVFLQEFDRSYYAILVWIEEGSTSEIELALYVIGPGIELSKSPPQTLAVVEVNGQPGAYVQGEHMLMVDGEVQFGILVDAPALIWEEGQLTYRIEANLPLEELMLIAESLK